MSGIIKNPLHTGCVHTVRVLTNKWKVWRLFLLLFELQFNYILLVIAFDKLLDYDKIHIDIDKIHKRKKQTPCL